MRATRLTICCKMEAVIMATGVSTDRTRTQRPSKTQLRRLRPQSTNLKRGSDAPPMKSIGDSFAPVGRPTVPKALLINTRKTKAITRKFPQPSKATIMKRDNNKFKGPKALLSSTNQCHMAMIKAQSPPHQQPMKQKCTGRSIRPRSISINIISRSSSFNSSSSSNTGGCLLCHITSRCRRQSMVQGTVVWQQRPRTTKESSQINNTRRMLLPNEPM